MLDRKLANLYSVPTKPRKQAVNRNLDRFLTISYSNAMMTNLKIGGRHVVTATADRIGTAAQRPWPHAPVLMA